MSSTSRLSKLLRPLLPLAGLATLATVVLLARDAAASSPAPQAPQPKAGEGRVVAEGRLAAYPGAEIVVSTEVAGILVALPVQERQAVKRGQLVAELRADDLRAELAEARARVTETEAEVKLAETELARAEELYAKHVDTAARRDRAARDLDVTRARTVAARATIGRLDAELAKRRIVSPIDGVVVVRSADPGETVEARAPIVTVADLSRVRIEAEVDEFDASRITLGAGAIVTAEGFAGQRWRGTIEEIPDAVSGRRLKPQDPGKPQDTRVLIVKVKLAEPTPLKLGQRVEVEIGG